MYSCPHTSVAKQHDAEGYGPAHMPLSQHFTILLAVALLSCLCHNTKVRAIVVLTCLCHSTTVRTLVMLTRLSHNTHGNSRPYNSSNVTSHSQGYSHPITPRSRHHTVRAAVVLTTPLSRYHTVRAIVVLTLLCHDNTQSEP